MVFMLSKIVLKAEASHTGKHQSNKDVSFFRRFSCYALFMATLIPSAYASNASEKGNLLPSNVRKIVFDKHLKHIEPYEQCLIASARRSNLPEMLLLSILYQEDGRVGKYSVNRNKTKDHGISQINDVRAPELKPIGLTIDEIRNDGCKSIIALTYLLANEYQKAGDLWTAVGNYHYSKHGPYPKHHYKYIKNVHAKWQRLYTTIKREISNDSTF
jgi:hypothetical protein